MPNYPFKSFMKFAGLKNVAELIRSIHQRLTFQARMTFILSFMCFFVGVVFLYNVVWSVGLIPVQAKVDSFMVEVYVIREKKKYETEWKKTGEEFHVLINYRYDWAGKERDGVLKRESIYPAMWMAESVGDYLVKNGTTVYVNPINPNASSTWSSWPDSIVIAGMMLGLSYFLARWGMTFMLPAWTRS